MQNLIPFIVFRPDPSRSRSLPGLHIMEYMVGDQTFPDKAPKFAFCCRWTEFGGIFRKLTQTDGHAAYS